MAGTGVTQQDLWDYLDGALTAPERRRAVEAALAGDQKLAAIFSVMRAQHHVLNQTDARVLQEKVPQRLVDVVRRAKTRAGQTG